MKRQRNRDGRQGNAIVEFSVMMSMMLPIFAATFTLGMSLSKALQVSNVCRDGAVLMVRSATDPNAGLDLSIPQNQKIIVRAAAGLGMALDAAYNPDPNGKALMVLSKVVLVADAECSRGIVPAPPSAPPWNAGNCPNYNSYVFAYRVNIGNTSAFTSTVGAPPSGSVRSDGTLSDRDIATLTSNRASLFGASGLVTLQPSTFALVSEMFADIRAINLFSIFNSPTIYSRNIS